MTSRPMDSHLMREVRHDVGSSLRKKRGGSTYPMQVLVRDPNRPRTVENEGTATAMMKASARMAAASSTKRK